MIGFVLISNKRTGSTFLQECLNSHPNIKCYDEMFLTRPKTTHQRNGTVLYAKRRKDLTVMKYLEGLSKIKKRSGVRIVYPQLDHGHDLRTGIKEQNISIIHLIRKNYFEQAMSYYTKDIDIDKITINTDSLLGRMKKIEEDTKKYRKMYRGNEKYLEIYYENIVGKIEGEKENVKKRGSFNLMSDQTTYIKEPLLEEICKFLGIENKELYSNVTKRTKGDVGSYIENTEEVRDVLIHHGYGDMIKEMKYEA